MLLVPTPPVLQTPVGILLEAYILILNPFCTASCDHQIAHHEVHLPSLKNASCITRKKRNQTVLDHTRIASEEPHLPCPSTL